MGALVSAIVKDMQWNRPVEKIARRQNVSVEVVEQILQLDWLPYFVNARRDGYDFDARWEDGHANRREKAIMDVYIGEDEDGLKNYQGIVTGLMMQTYLVIVDFKRRVSKKGEEYGSTFGRFPDDSLTDRRISIASCVRGIVRKPALVFGRFKKLTHDDAKFPYTAGLVTTILSRCEYHLTIHRSHVR